MKAATYGFSFLWRNQRSRRVRNENGRHRSIEPYQTGRNKHVSVTSGAGRRACSNCEVGYKGSSNSNKRRRVIVNNRGSRSTLTCTTPNKPHFDRSLEPRPSTKNIANSVDTVGGPAYSTTTRWTTKARIERRRSGIVIRTSCYLPHWRRFDLIVSQNVSGSSSAGGRDFWNFSILSNFSLGGFSF